MFSAAEALSRQSSMLPPAYIHASVATRVALGGPMRTWLRV